jgi:hypothetical protein
MAIITLRQSNVVPMGPDGLVKGSPLTNIEVDNNFANINVTINTLSSQTGPVASLTTGFKGNVVYAINELRSNLTTSAGFATIITDETGSGSVVFNTSPSLSGTPQSVTAANATSNAMIATTQFVNNQIQNSPNIQLPVINNIQMGYTSTPTTGGTTTLTSQSTYQWIFTGSSNQTVVLPQTSTLALGQSFHIENNGTGVITIQSYGTNIVTTIPALLTVMVTCTNLGSDAASSWDYDYHAFGGLSGNSGNVVISGSPTLSGTPQAITAAAGTSNAMIATTAFVSAAVAAANTGGGSSNVTTGKSIAMAMIFGF